jgi:CheY-like chemotaxis protein
MNEDTKHLLLVLDDDSAVRDSLKFLLEVEGFNVRTFASPDGLLTNKIATGEIDKVRHSLPADLHALWPSLDVSACRSTDACGPACAGI